MQTLFSHLAWFLSAGFAATGALLVFGQRYVPEAFAARGLPDGFGKVTGRLLLAAAALMMFPLTHLVGLGIALLATFLAATTLLNNRQYRLAMPVIAVLFALVPVSLSTAL